MALIYQDGVTIDEATRKVVGVGDLRGQQPSVVQTPTGQNISKADPNYNAYVAQNAMSSSQKLTSSQIPLGGYVPQGNREALPTVSTVPDLNKDVYKPPETVVTPTGSKLEVIKKQPLTAGATPVSNIQGAVPDGAYERAGVQPTKGTFVNPATGKREAFVIGQQPQGFLLEERIPHPSKIGEYTVTYKSKDGKTLYGIRKTQDVTPGATQGATQAVVPGANPQIPDTTIPPAPEIAAPDNTIDPMKFLNSLEADLSKINTQIANVEKAYDTSINELGNQVGEVAPLIQGEQAYQQNKKQIELNYLQRSKENLIQTAELKLQVFEYARNLRKDQQDTMGIWIEKLYASGADPDKLDSSTLALLDKYEKMTGISKYSILDGMKALYAQQALDNQLAQGQLQLEQAGVLGDTLTENLKNQLLAKELATYGQTESYKNYQLAGGMDGTGMDYDTWLRQSSTTTKPPTEAELKNVGYYQRANDANTILNKLDNWSKNLSFLGQTWQVLTGDKDFLKTANGKAYAQARRQFTEAYLRRDSGAMISPSEYANADRIYFVQPGDTPQIVAQKKKARETIINSLKVSSGSAIQEDTGGEWSW